MASKQPSPIPRFLHAPLALAFRSVISLPLMGQIPVMAEIAAGLGRAFGGTALNRNRLMRADVNLQEVFPHWTPEQRRSHALDAYAHLFRLAVELAFTPRKLNFDGWRNHIILPDLTGTLSSLLSDRPCILITGHVGNWELIGSTIGMLGFPLHAVYRPLDLEPLDLWLRESRQRQGLSLVSKFGAVHELPKVLARGKPIGLVADQNGGHRGIFVPFFGRLTSTYKSIGLLAMQFNATMVCGFARRMTPQEAIAKGLTPQQQAGMRYQVEIVDSFGPEDWAKHPDPLFYLTARYRRAMERMILIAPDQYLWMHRIWRSRPPHEQTGKPFPPALREKLSLLPWMTEEDVARVVERSERGSGVAR